MTAPSFFSRISKYRPGASDPRENRLTEITAATLENVRDLPVAFARALLKPASGVSVPAPSQSEALARLDALVQPTAQIRTQRAAGGGFVDIELILRCSATGDDLKIWVEVKHQAGLHGDQLATYDASLNTAPGAGVIIVVAPRSRMPQVDGVVVVSWQHVARVLRTTHSVVLPPEQHWLLEQYFSYLREEGLMDPNSLTPEHATALDHVRRAVSVAHLICEEAVSHVNAVWPTALEPGDRKVNLWFPYLPTAEAEPPHGNWSNYLFEWGFCSTDDWYPDVPFDHSYAFYAGISFESNASTISAPAELRHWRALVEGAEFEWIFFGGRYRYVRTTWPEALLGATDLSAQAALLSAEVVDAFNTLAGIVPDVPLPR